MTRIYKIAQASAWSAAVSAGVFEGAPVDLADGFIHFSTAAQARETARRYFAGQADLVLAAFDSEAFAGSDLRWEVSRGGDLFPHLYGPLDPALAVEVRALALDETGIPMLGDLIP